MDPDKAAQLTRTVTSWLLVSNLALRRLRGADVVVESDTNKLLRLTRLKTKKPDTDSASWHQVNQLLADAHLLLVAYKHVSSGLKLLLAEGCLTGSLLMASSGFLTLYESDQVSNFRDMLEHQEEYIAGTGRKQDLLGGHPFSFAVGVDPALPEGNVLVSIAERDYELRHLEEAALNLWKELDPDSLPATPPRYHDREAR